MKRENQRIHQPHTPPPKAAPPQVSPHRRGDNNPIKLPVKMKLRRSIRWIVLAVLVVGLFEMIQVADLGWDHHRSLDLAPLTVVTTTNATTVSSTKSTKKKKRVFYYRPMSATDDNNHQTFGGVQARVFPRKSLPCLPPEPNWKMYKTQMTPTREGFLFLKTFKTGSSTASGIDLRIARNVARRRQLDFDVCKTRYDHAWASKLYKSLHPQRSFLWTIVRDPISRVVSALFHFHVSRDKNNATDDSLMGRIRRDVGMMHNYYIRSLSRRGFDKQNPVQVANEILQQYDFIAVTERMEESAVALAMLLGTPLADVLYLKAKGNGGYDDAGGTGVCTYITPSFVSDGMDTFFRSDEYQDYVQWDHLLYQAANKSLDLTIEALGRTKFEQNLSKFRLAQERAVEQCLPTTRFPCSSTGQRNKETDCLWNDSGCGYKCLDDVSTELGLWN